MEDEIAAGVDQRERSDLRRANSVVAGRTRRRHVGRHVGIGRAVLVDDEPRLLSSLYEQLRDRSYHLVTATCGSEALAQLNRMQFDLVLLDLRLPDMSGFDVLKALRQLPLVAGASMPASPRRRKRAQSSEVTPNWVASPAWPIGFLKNTRTGFYLGKTVGYPPSTARISGCWKPKTNIFLTIKNTTLTGVCTAWA